MANQPLDRVPRDGAGQEQAVRDWIFDRSVPCWPMVLLGLALTLTIGYWRLRGYLARRAAARAWMQDVHSVSRHGHLTLAEEKALLRALAAADLVAPKAALKSYEYFDTFVKPRLEAAQGPSMCRGIRRKLFGGDPACTPDSSQLPILRQGIKLPEA